MIHNLLVVVGMAWMAAFGLVVFEIGCAAWDDYQARRVRRGRNVRDASSNVRRIR